MKEIDFLPSRLPGASDRRLWRFGTIVAVAAVVAILGALHAIRPVSISSAQTGTPGAAGSSDIRELRRMNWTLPAGRTTQDLQIDALLVATFGSESETLLIETFKARYATTAVAIRLHSDSTPAEAAETPISNLLGPEDVKPLSAELRGFAATDLDIGRLVGRLSACPFAGNVRLVEASEATVHDRRMRAFRIELDIGHECE
jgi:hypothetical protein